ncbi:unnamed protein product [Leptidea sinapis]|uniref:Uncharacterized protein n=1 Tax=Leptidea sinapis TaxID=189913 RepID=A0A5E4PTQ2_9NEOP|nr:unnamed protein product [Leptidea sinapis]
MSSHFPEAAKIAESSLYTDDLVYSAPNEETAKNLAQDLIKMFASGSFDLEEYIPCFISYLLQQLINITLGHSGSGRLGHGILHNCGSKLWVSQKFKR